MHLSNHFVYTCNKRCPNNQSNNANKQNKCEEKWSYKSELANKSLGYVEDLLLNVENIKEFEDTKTSGTFNFQLVWCNESETSN